MASFDSVNLEWRNGSHDDINVVAIASFSIVTALLSLIGAGSVLVCSLYHKRVFYPEIFPTFHLAVADLLASLSVIVSSVKFLIDKTGSHGTGVTCATISGLITSFYTSAFLLTLVYALEILFRFRKRLKEGSSLDYLSLMEEMKKSNLQILALTEAKTKNKMSMILKISAVSSRPMYLAYAFSWLAPLVVAGFVIVKTHNELRHTQKMQLCSMCFTDFRFDGENCWTGADGENFTNLHRMARLLLLIPLVLVMFINMILYALIWRTYRQVVIRSGLLSYHQRQEENLLRRKTCYYQAVFFVCWIPAIIVGYASFSTGYTMSRFYPGLVIQIILGPLQGLLNSIVYGWKRDSFRRALTESSSLLSTNRTAMMENGPIWDHSDDDFDKENGPK